MGDIPAAGFSGETQDRVPNLPADRRPAGFDPTAAVASPPGADARSSVVGVITKDRQCSGGRSRIAATKWAG